QLHSITLIFFLTLQRPPRFTLFPYTTLFRSTSILFFSRPSTGTSPGHTVPIRKQAQGTWQPEEKRKLRGQRTAPSGKARETTARSEEHTSELQSPCNLVCRLLLEKKKKKKYT